MNHERALSSSSFGYGTPALILLPLALSSGSSIWRRTGGMQLKPSGIILWNWSRPGSSLRQEDTGS